MPPKTIDILDSDDKQNHSRSRTSTITTKSSWKRPCSKGPASKQSTNKHPKVNSTKDGGNQTKTAGKKSKIPVTALSFKQRAAKHSASRVSTMEKRMAWPPRDELALTIDRINKSNSPAYTTFKLPKLIKPRVKEAPYEYHGFVCKTCCERIQRKIGSSETSSLLKHQARCKLQKHQGLLSKYGITSGGGPPLLYDVRQYVVQWVSENGRPFAIVYDHYLRKLFPAKILNLLPLRLTIAKDISTVYTMAQNVIRRMLADIDGCFHIGLDMYQAPNGHDILGLVIFYPEVNDNVIHIKQFVLECLSFGGKHTGVALANTVYGILRKFKIEDRVWRVVCDNAANNVDMMNRFKKFKMKRLTGPEVRVHCLLHVLNLASKAIAAPFLKERSNNKVQCHSTEVNELDNLGLSGEEDNQETNDETDKEDVRSVSEDFDPDNEDETGQDDGTAPSRVLDDDDEEDDDLSDVVIPDLVASSLDAKELKGTRQALNKIAWFARKLQFSPQFRKSFHTICEELDKPSPHNIQRNVVIRWNSTKSMIEDAVCLEGAVLQFQRSPEFPVKQRLAKKDFLALKILLQLLKPLSILMEIMSRSNVPMLADVLVHYDSLNHEYCQMATDRNLPLWAQQAANRARIKLDKYYQITNSSHLYRLAIFLHPSNRIAYLKKVEWRPEWISSASELAVNIWAKHYKPEGYNDSRDDVSSQSQFGYSLIFQIYSDFFHLGKPE